jgi:MoxR-like ATPase
MDRFMFKLVVNFPTLAELTEIVTMTQVTMNECAEAVLTGEDLLKMRQVAKEILVMDDVLQYTMKLVSATHPELETSPDFARDYIRIGASPRAAQALITAGKVRALMNGRFNVSYDDINALAYPVLRHRIKPSFRAITEKMSADVLITRLIALVSGKKVAVENTEAEGKGKRKHK